MNDVKTNSHFIKSIEDSVKKIQNTNRINPDKRVIEENLDTIKKMINYEFKEISCEKVYLTMNDAKSVFFGISVFPTTNELERIADALVTVDERIKISPVTKFIIELDSKLMFDIGATAEEVTAGLLHEIGHRINNTEELITLKWRVATGLARITGLVGSTVLLPVIRPVKWLLFNAILLTFTSLLDEMMKLKDEVNADSLAIKYGYAAPLKSLLEKIEQHTELYIWSDNATEESQKVIIQWSLQNMVSYAVRKREIEKFLREQQREEKSPHVKGVLTYQLAQLSRTKMSNVTNETVDKLILESISTFFELRRKGSSELEIDEIKVEMDQIEDMEDKLYLVSRIYKDFDLANAALATYNQNKLENKNNIEEIERFKKELNKLLEIVRNKKVQRENDFQIIIKNPPNDYEGRDYVKL